jgi:hypothetical protein
VTVVSGQARRRWAVVAAGIAVLICLPAVTAAAQSWLGTRHSGAPPSGPVAARSILRRALASSAVAHSGLSESRGDLGLPDLPRLENVTSILGSTTTTRVWWAGSRSWRVDVVTPTGEQGLYQAGAKMFSWDYESSELTRVVGSPSLRLPRADDLLPPQAARRLLAGVGPKDSVTTLPGWRRIAGAEAEGIRITPADARSSIGHIDVWVDRDHGLPVAVTAVDDHGVTAVESRFLQLSFGTPSAADLAVPSAPGAHHDATSNPDILSRIAPYGFAVLPYQLAGLTTAKQIVGGTATYGSGLVKVVVVPLPRRLAGEVLDATRTGGGTSLDLPGGEALLVSSGVVELAVLRTDDQQRAYLVTGLVTPAVVTQAAAELLAPTPALNRTPS